MIRPDSWIKDRCTRPTHRLIYPTDPNRVTETPGGGQVTTLIHHDPRPQSVPLTEEELASWRPMIEPFSPTQVKEVDGRRIISAGLSSFGYDVTLSDEFKLFSNINSSLIDPKQLNEGCLVNADIKKDPNGASYVILPPNSYLLGRTVEYFVIPRNVMVLAVGKSTLARAGAIINVTPIEPGFEGEVVIEISNATNLPMKIYAFEGIAQFLFFESETDCEVSYADRGGKYQGQKGLTLPKV